jgi:hypothetical protein
MNSSPGMKHDGVPAAQRPTVYYASTVRAARKGAIAATGRAW